MQINILFSVFRQTESELDSESNYIAEQHIKSRKDLIAM